MHLTPYIGWYCSARYAYGPTYAYRALRIALYRLSFRVNDRLSSIWPFHLVATEADFWFEAMHAWVNEYK